jgi:nucleoside-diphosphate-sugar epimerase
MGDRGRVILITGWPGFIGRRLVRHLRGHVDPAHDRVVLFTRGAHGEAAREELAALELPGDVLEGDVTQMHLGLSGPEYKSLLGEVTDIWHLAARYDVSAGANAIRTVNLEGTRHVLELARAARRLARLNHFSTAYVSGDRQGVILEEELEAGQGFHDAYERSKFAAERLVRRAMAEIPATVYRPTIVVGDSRTGEVDRFDGPYYLAILLIAAPMRVPLPGNGLAPLNVVPVDFVVDAALSIAANPAGIGKTVHLADPSPLSTRKVYELAAARAGKSLPRVALPHRVVEALLGLPILERLTRPQRNAIRLTNHFAVYHCRNQLDLLAGTGIRCPPITTYLDRLIEFVRANLSARPRRMEDVDDPLDVTS